MLTLALAAILGGCGTVVEGTTQKVKITSVPEGAEFVDSPSGQHGVTPAEVNLERRHDHAVTFNYPGYATRTMYVRRTLADVPQGGNVASCVPLPFICMAFAGIDAASGGEFNLVPVEVQAELRPAGETAITLAQSRVTFFNGGKGLVTFSIDGSGDECSLKANQFTTRVLSVGHHDVHAYHWDVFKMSGTYPLDLDGAEVYVAIFDSVFSTHAAFANELPTDFHEACPPG